MIYKVCVVVCFVILSGRAFTKPLIELDAELKGGYFEGDMILTEEQKAALMDPPKTRNGLIAESKRWPNKIVYYKIIGDFDIVQVQAIHAGIQVLEAKTCIRFREAAADQPHYLAITSKTGGCFTAVGFQAKVQEMNLEPYPIGEGCFRSGTIVHEFMHALGFYHQQSDANRDEFITVVYENIVPGKEFNFKKYGASIVTDFDIGYDYESCLHYRSIAFSKNGQDTIVPHDRSAQIGQRKALSKKDIDKINMMYKCPIQV